MLKNVYLLRKSPFFCKIIIIFATYNVRTCDGEIPNLTFRAN